MTLQILSIQSDELEPKESGFPDSLEEFDVLVEVELCFKNQETNSMYFEFYVASPLAQMKRSTGGFLPPTLLVDEFDWKLIRKHVEKSLMQALNCKTWDGVVIRLNGLLRPSSPSCYKWVL